MTAKKKVAPPEPELEQKRTSIGKLQDLQEQIASVLDIPEAKAIRLLKDPGQGWDFCLVFKDNTLRIEASGMKITELQSFMRGVLWHMNAIQQ
jgi:hypothetical protein